MSSNLIIAHHIKDLNPNITNSKGADMALLEELKKLITKVENGKDEDMTEEKKKEADNEKIDKRDIIRQIMAIAGKHEDNEDVRTIAKLAEKLAYDKSEAGTADNKAKNKCAKNEDDDFEYEELKEEIEEEAIEHLLKNKNGFVPAAIHKEEIGDIDFVYGKEGKKVMAWHTL